MRTVPGQRSYPITMQRYFSPRITALDGLADESLPGRNCDEVLVDLFRDACVAVSISVLADDEQRFRCGIVASRPDAGGLNDLWRCMAGAREVRRNEDCGDDQGYGTRDVKLT